MSNRRSPQGKRTCCECGKSLLPKAGVPYGGELECLHGRYCGSDCFLDAYARGKSTRLAVAMAKKPRG